MRRRTYIAGIAVAAALAAAGTVTATGVAGTQERQVVLAHGDDRLPSTTAADWVTYADHVVVVTAAAEQSIAPTRTEVERGEGLIGRTVRLDVRQVLWSRDGAPQPAPKSWDYNATGALFTDRNVEAATPMALEDRPRIETGHQYILAITWEPGRCSAGDVPEPARWMGLGEGSELPFDNGVIGEGEMEGQVQTVADARTLATEAGVDAGLEEELAGSGAEALVAKLKAAPSGQRQQSEPEVAAESCD